MNEIDRILELAKQNGVKQSYLNDLIGGYRGKITDWKNGKSKPSESELKTLAGYFNVSAEYLSGKTDEPSIRSTQDLNPEQTALWEKIEKKNLTAAQLKKINAFIDLIIDDE